jgi:hypothetical protein
VHFYSKPAAQAGVVLAVGVFLLGLGVGAANAQISNYVTFSQVSSSAYGTQDTNSCAVDSVNNLTTVGNYQYIAFYNQQGDAMVGRRAVSSSANNTNPWTIDEAGADTGRAGAFVPYTADSGSGGIADDHHTISIAVDGNGDMHISWGMHNDVLNYGISGSVSGSSFGSAGQLDFTTQVASGAHTGQANDPTLFSQLGSVDQVTYPQFYSIPNSNGTASGNLLFIYRDAAAATGGGSGNGNEYMSVYTASTSSFSTPAEVMNGGATTVNGYLNNLAFSPSGNLVTTWTWRQTPNWQTNYNLMYAQSPSYAGASANPTSPTWYQTGSETPASAYALPIESDTSGGGSSAQVGQVIYTIPTNSSYINQAGMVLDRNGNPITATYMAPGSPANPNLQYVVFYNNGTNPGTYEESTITNRTSDTTIDTSGNDVRDLGRPIVLIDNQQRVLVVTRFEDSGQGDFSNPLTPDNYLRVFWTTESQLFAGDPAWQEFTLDPTQTNLGQYEPSFDTSLWASSNILDLFYEPVGLSGETSATADVLQFNEQAYFASLVPEPGSLGVLAGCVCVCLLMGRRSRRPWLMH